MGAFNGDTAKQNMYLVKAYKCHGGSAFLGMMVKGAWDSFTNFDDCESAGGSIFNLAQAAGEAAVGGAMAGKIPLAGRKINCFPAGTLVQLADSTVKPIEEVTDKDLVWARDDSTGETKACRIKRTFHKSADELVVLSFGEVGDTSGKIVESIRCTVEHPFYVDGRGWIGASDLGIGTEIVTRAGPNLVVRKVEREKHPGGIGVYNFEVEEFHSYFVGEANGGLWVHNDCLKGINSLFGKTEKQVLRAAPRNWRKVPTGNQSGRTNGWKLVDENGVERVRFMRPEDNVDILHTDTFGRRGQGYWRWQNAAGDYLDEYGNVVPTTHPEFNELTHIIYSGRSGR